MAAVEQMSHLSQNSKADLSFISNHGQNTS